MMSTWRRTLNVRPRQRSSQCQRLRRRTRSCCGERICARIEKVLKISQNQRSAELQSYETVFNKLVVKFGQCRPRLQAVKSRLQESCELLSEIDELLDFFCDPQRLLAYVLEEQPRAHLASTDLSQNQKIEPAGKKAAPLGRDKPKSIGSESFRLKNPRIETITEEVEVSPPPSTGPVKTTLTNGVDGSVLRPETGSLLNGSQKRALQMQSPDAPFYSPLEGERNDPLNFNTSNTLAKRFKTSTPAGHAPLDSSLWGSLLSQLQCGRRRRKAMIIEPPEENGAWMGTPVIRNKPDSQSSQTKGLEKRRSISINAAENEKRISITATEDRRDQEECTLAPVTHVETVGKNAVALDEGGSDMRKAEDQRERVVLREKPEQRQLAHAGSEDGPLCGKNPMKKVAQIPGKIDRKNRRGIVDVAPPSRAAEESFPPERPRRKAAGNVCYTESTAKKKKK